MQDSDPGKAGSLGGKLMQQRIPLAAIAPGETVRVAEIRVEGALRRRLFDLGL